MSTRTLSQWLQRIEALHPDDIDLGLERVATVYAKFAQAPLPRVISVAGTNGKGSTVECLTRCAMAVGQRTGSYTSPHLVRFNERMCLNAEPASDAQIIAAFEVVEKARGDTPLTYFEFTTLAAFALFRNENLDLWVLEVGLGGRLDAVNIIDADVAVITAIGLDHQDWLGNDRETIGREKAGIFRAGQVAVCSDPNPPVSIATYAHDLGARLLQIGADFTHASAQSTWNFIALKPLGGSWMERTISAHADEDSRGNLPQPAGAVLDNMAGALAALAALDMLPPEPSLSKVFSSWSLRGRLQRLELQVPWWLDVAHNTESAALLHETLAAAMKREALVECYVVLGMLADKPVTDVIAALAPLATQWLIVELDSPRSLSGEELAQKVQLASTARIEILQSVAAGVAMARARAGKGACVVVTGSFHTVGPALAWLGY